MTGIRERALKFNAVCQGHASATNIDACISIKFGFFPLKFAFDVVEDGDF